MYNKNFTGEWEVSFSFYYFMLLDSAFARNEVFKYWIKNRAQIAILLFMDFYLCMKISFLSSWRYSRYLVPAKTEICSDLMELEWKNSSFRICSNMAIS